MRELQATRYKLQAGFSLIEVLIATLLIASSAALYSVALYAGTLTQNARYEDIALRIAQTQLERLRAASYAALPPSGPFSDSQLSMLPAGAASTTISTFNEKTKQVSVGVSWQPPGKPARAVSLTTLITEVGGL